LPLATLWQKRFENIQKGLRDETRAIRGWVYVVTVERGVVVGMHVQKRNTSVTCPSLKDLPFIPHAPL